MGPREVQPRAPRAKAAGALPPAPCFRVLWGCWESLRAGELCWVWAPTGSQEADGPWPCGVRRCPWGPPGAPSTPLCLGPPEVEGGFRPRALPGPRDHREMQSLPTAPQVRCCSAGGPGAQSPSRACSPASWRTTSSWTSSEPRHPIKFLLTHAPAPVTDIPQDWAGGDGGRHLCPCSRFSRRPPRPRAGEAGASAVSQAIWCSLASER